MALDMFSGCGGSSEGIEAAGIDVWYAANHWEYAVTIHERNHPGAEHFIADLVDTEATDYYHPEQLPAADVLWASPSCTNHSRANATRAYQRNLSLFDIHDDDYEDQVTTSERSRATAVCVLQYARKHHPMVMAIENVVEFANWGTQVGNSRRGDGSTFRWWLNEIHKLGYRTRILWLNSMFFGVPQSRDRMYIACWDQSLREPDLDFRLPAWCHRCDQVVESRQTFKSRTKAWPLAQWGKYGDQYLYRCTSCLGVVEPASTPALYAIDWSDLGTRIADRDTSLADSTMARIERGVDKYFRNGQWPQVVMPAKAIGRGAEAATDRPFPTQTTQQEQALLSLQVVVAGNTHERPGSTCRIRNVTEPLWTQHTTAAVGVVNHPALVDNYQGTPRTVDESLPTQTGGETMALVRPPNYPSSFMVKNNGGADPACRSYPTSEPLGTVVGSANHQGLIVAPVVHTARGHHEGRAATLDPVTDPITTVSAGGNHHYLLSAIFAKQNGGPADTAWHTASSEALGTMTGADTTCLVAPPAEPMPPIVVEDCLYRMLKPTEIKAGMGIRHDFEMWGTARNQVRALGNAVTPPVSTSIMLRLAAVLRG